MDIINEEKKILIFTSKQKLFQFAAKDFKERVLATLTKKNTFSVALSGGNTPKPFYDLLTKYDNEHINFPWDKIKFFFGDERYVPLTSSSSNYHAAYQYLFSKLPIPSQNIFPIRTDFTDPNEAAIYYEQTIKSQLTYKNNLPQFDLIYLGMGEDGHTASLMPQSNIVIKCINHASENRLVESDYISHLKMYRTTLTPLLINNAGVIIFLVTDSEKANAVSHILDGARDPLHYPAQLIHANHGETIWYLDSSAASHLRNNLHEQ